MNPQIPFDKRLTLSQLKSLNEDSEKHALQTQEIVRLHSWISQANEWVEKVEQDYLQTKTAIQLKDLDKMLK